MNYADEIPTFIVDLPHNISGLSSVDENGTPMIYLNARHTSQKNRDTFEHELAHMDKDDLHNDDPIELVETRAAERISAPEHEAPKQNTPTRDEQYATVFQRGKEMYGLEKDSWLWDYLFAIWFHRDTMFKGTTIAHVVLKDYNNTRIGTMIEQLFRGFH